MPLPLKCRHLVKTVGGDDGDDDGDYNVHLVKTVGGDDDGCPC